LTFQKKKKALSFGMEVVSHEGVLQLIDSMDSRGQHSD
jgi:hypothetical protein